MRLGLLPGALLLGLSALAVADSAQPGHTAAGTDAGGPAGGEARPARRPRLKYALLPDPLDLTQGNAAPLWIRAGEAASNVQHKLTRRNTNGAPVARRSA